MFLHCKCTTPYLNWASAACCALSFEEHVSSGTLWPRPSHHFVCNLIVSGPQRGGVPPRVRKQWNVIAVMWSKGGGDLKFSIKHSCHSYVPSGMQNWNALLFKFFNRAFNACLSGVTSVLYVWKCKLFDILKREIIWNYLFTYISLTSDLRSWLVDTWGFSHWIVEY